MAPAAHAAHTAVAVATTTALSILVALCLAGGLPEIDAKPLETTPKYGIIIQIPPEFVRAVPLGPNGEPLLSELGEGGGRGGDGAGGGGAGAAGGGEGRRAFPSLFLSDADTIFGPSFSSHAVSKRVRSKSSYKNSDMAAPRVHECEAYCALTKDTHA